MVTPFCHVPVPSRLGQVPADLAALHHGTEQSHCWHCSPQCQDALSPAPGPSCPQQQDPRFLLFPGAGIDRTGCVPRCPLPHGAGVHGAGGVEGDGVCGHPGVLSAPQFLLPHSRGSSHGQSRIIRSVYTQEYYSRMMPESFRLWQQLEAETGTTLYR